MKKILFATTAAVGLSALASAVGLFVTAQPETFSSRWQHATSELEQIHLKIPNEKLHAQALEILRTRTVADDDGSNADTQACLAFNPPRWST